MSVILSYSGWKQLNETAFAFDPNANYPDQTFGLPAGSVGSGKVTSGGVGSDWNGALPRALAFGKIANDFMGKNVITSQKRKKKNTASGNTSDHYEGGDSAYAVDLACKGQKGDELLAHLMKWFGHPEYVGGKWFNVTKNGYRYQIGWRVPGHFNHIHVGVKKTGENSNVSSNQSNTELNQDSAVNDKSAKPNILDKLMAALGINKKALGLESGEVDTTSEPTTAYTDGTISPTISNKKIRSNYSGEAAKNIDLLVSEMEAAGIVNPHAQIGILSVIGKESNFIPKSEIMSYSPGRLAEVWGVFSKTGSAVPKGQGQNNYNELALEYANDPEKLANFVYGQKPYGMRDNAYGNTSPGDGWKYRGRGFNQITFKGTYENYGKLLGLDLVSNPDLLNDPKIAAKAAVVFLLDRLKSKGIDPNSFTGTDSAIETFAAANAGWGKDPSRAIASAKKIEPNFSIAQPA